MKSLWESALSLASFLALFLRVWSFGASAQSIACLLWVYGLLDPSIHAWSRGVLVCQQPFPMLRRERRSRWDRGLGGDWRTGGCRVKCVHMRFWMKLGNSVVSDIGDMLTWRLWPLVGWKGESEKEWGERDRGVCVCVVCKRWSVIVKLCCVVRPKFGLVWGCRCYNFEAAEWMHSHFWGCEILRSEWTWRGMQVAWSLRAIAIGVESFFEWEWEVKSLSVVASRGILSLRSEVTTSSRSFRINSRLLLVYLTIIRLVI